MTESTTLGHDGRGLSHLVGEPHAHVDPLAAEGHALGLQQRALPPTPVPGGGARLLELLEGMDAHDALRMLVAGDEERDVRQFGIVDARGAATAHTGGACIPFAGDSGGPGYTCQANMMATPEV